MKLTNVEILVEDVRVGDVYLDKTIAEVLVGRKWVHAKDENGKTVFREEVGTRFGLFRWAKTDEELAAEQLEKELEQLNRENEYLKDDLERNLPRTPAAVMAELLSREGNPGLTHWDLDKLMAAQAESEFYAAVARYVEKFSNDGVPECIADYGIYVAAFAAAAASRRSRNTHPNPLSRSTSATANLMEDLVAFVFSDKVSGHFGTPSVKRAYSALISER